VLDVSPVGMRLLVLTEYFPSGEQEGITGGVESRALHLLREIARTDEVTMICSYQGGAQRRRDTVAGIEVRRVGPVHPYANEGHVATRFAYAAAALAEGLRDRPFDVVEGFSYVTYPAAAALGRLRRRPAVATFHESWSHAEWVHLKGRLTGTLGSAWVRGALALGFDRTIAVSEVTKRQLVAQGVPAERISVVHNGVDLEAFAGVTAAPAAPASVATSVRLIASKRADLLLRAVARLRPQLTVSLTIHGQGPEQAALEQLARELGLAAQVSFVGRLARFEDALALRRRHQVFCLPSISEGFGMVVIEAMALGLPVVCTDIPVLREVAGDAALFFRPDDAGDLAAQLERLLGDEILRADLGGRARARAQAFSWARLADQARAVYAGRPPERP
jgi:glycosyltransferase involved in cell wall biosynthesis